MLSLSQEGGVRGVIGVIGESAFSDPAHDALAEEVGRRIAASGCALICGGLGGVMEAAARGAREAGGVTIGVLPGPTRAEANPHIDIAIGGGYGTLAEIGHALRHGKPVVGLRTWEAARGGDRAPITVVETAEDAVRAALRAAPR